MTNFIRKYLTIYFSILGGIIFTIICCLLMTITTDSFTSDWVRVLQSNSRLEDHIRNFVIGFVITFLLVWGIRLSKETKGD